MITITKVDIVEEYGVLTPAIFIHDDLESFTLFIDANKRIRTIVPEFIFTSQTPIIKI